MANLSWKILTKKRPGVTQGLPPGTDVLAWVTNTVTLIHGEHDAIGAETRRTHDPLNRDHSRDVRGTELDIDFGSRSGAVGDTIRGRSKGRGTSTICECQKLRFFTNLQTRMLPRRPF